MTEKNYILTRNDVDMIFCAAVAEAQGASDTEGLANVMLEAHAQPTCCIEGHHEDSSGVSWLLSCDHDVEGYAKPCYCSVCGARVVDTVIEGGQE